MCSFQTGMFLKNQVDILFRKHISVSLYFGVPCEARTMMLAKKTPGFLDVAAKVEGLLMWFLWFYTEAECKCLSLNHRH